MISQIFPIVQEYVLILVTRDDRKNEAGELFWKRKRCGMYLNGHFALYINSCIMLYFWGLGYGQWTIETAPRFNIYYLIECSIDEIYRHFCGNLNFIKIIEERKLRRLTDNLFGKQNYAPLIVTFISEKTTFERLFVIFKWPMKKKITMFFYIQTC